MNRLNRRSASYMLIGLVSLACGSSQTTNAPAQMDTGVTNDTIVIGASGPLTGPSSPIYTVIKGANAYFGYVNAHGGVNGRQIKYIVLDDGYDPAKTPAKATELVEQDNVFMSFGSMGTANNLAVRDYYNTRKVPQWIISSGASDWGQDYAKYPWTLGWMPTYVTEGEISAHHILQDEPGDRIAVLAQNDKYGTDNISGLKTGLGDKADSMVVATAPYRANDPVDMSEQVANLQASGANTLFVVATLAYAVDAVTRAIRSGWNPKIYMTSQSLNTSAWNQVVQKVGSSAGIDGMTTIAFVKDPLDNARWGADPGVKLFREVMSTYGDGCDPSGADTGCVRGMAAAFTLVEVLRKAGNVLTRKHVMDLACCQMNQTDNPLLLSGIVVKTTSTDHFPIQQAQLNVWQGNHWVPSGALIDVRR